MKLEEKKTLSTAILGYLPYKLKVRYYDMEDGREEDGYIEGAIFDRTEPEFYVDQYAIKAESLKPYLRPMESMTEKERKEYRTECNKVLLMRYRANNHYPVTDWLNAHHFDYRGLIPMGLALPATEGMYNIK